MSLRFLGRMSRIHVGGNLPSPKFCSSTALENWKQHIWQIEGTEKQEFLPLFFNFFPCLSCLQCFKDYLLFLRIIIESNYFVPLLIRWFSELKGLCFMILFIPWLINLTVLFLLLLWSIEEAVNRGRSGIIRIHKDPVIFIN